MADIQKIEQLRGELQGELLTPGDSAYDEARALWNGMVDRKPAMIVRVSGVEDVIAAVNFARSNDFEVSVKAGGHGVAGKAICDGGLVIDLSSLDDVQVDVEAKTVKAGGGTTLGKLDRETQAFRLSVPAGIVSETGIAGLTLGGGIGYQGRKYGLTVDNLLGAEMVLADGTFVWVSVEDHPDLFWAIRGGGGNFGVVTSFTYKAHELGPEVMTSLTYYDISEVPEVVRFYQEFMEEADNGAAVYCMFANVPPAPHLPEERHGTPAVFLHACYAGDVEEGRKVLAPLTEFGDPFFTAFAPMRFVDLQSAFDPAVPKGMRAYWKGANFETLSDEFIETLAERCKNIEGPMSLIGLEPLGGKISEIDPSTTAYTNRSARFSFGIWAGWNDPADDDRLIAWTRSFYDDIVEYSSEGVYFNYLDRDEEERVRASLGSNYERLREIKAKYDPGNMFRNNMNIAP